MLLATSRAVVTDEQRGSVTVDYDSHTGTVFVEFERLESDDAILLNYRVTLSTEHVVAWIESMLQALGRTCRRMDKDRTKKRLNALLNLTAKEPNLVYLSFCGANIVVVRDGCVLKTGFALESMNRFLSRIRELGSEGDTASVFANYVQGLMSPWDAQRNII
jgi:hypothetical protein